MQKKQYNFRIDPEVAVEFEKIIHPERRSVALRRLVEEEISKRKVSTIN